MSESESHYCKLPISDSKGDFSIVHSIWSEATTSINIITASNDEWSTIISRDEFEFFAKELEIPFEQFYKDCKSALTENNGLCEFSYIIKDDTFTLIKNDKFKTSYLEKIDLLPANNLANDVMSGSVEKIHELENLLKQNKIETKDRNAEYESLHDLYEKCVEEKNDLETRLLKKFALLLNAKKNKIAQLQDLLLEKNERFGEVASSRVEEDEHVSSIANKDKRPLATEILSDSDDDSFSAPTQVLKNPVLLKKRAKFDVEEKAKRQISNLDTTSNPIDENSPNDTEVNSENIFDKM